VAPPGEQRRHACRAMCRIHTFDPEDADIPFFEARDKMRDGALAEVHSCQVKHHRLTGKKTWRAGESCVYFFKPAHDRDDWGKNKRHVRSAPHANQLTWWLRNCVHAVRLGFLFELLRMGRAWLTIG
jgi:hypothetical protein